MPRSIPAIVGAVGLLRLELAGALRGVAPDDVASYIPRQEGGREVFHCLSSGEVVSFAEVNDGYCDCRDGSDEPGTEACAGRGNTTFYCANAQGRPSHLYPTLVNDGVCDCCDGSDEWRRGSCSNTCAEEGKVLQKQEAEIRQGLAERQRLIGEARAARARAEVELRELKAALPGLERALTTARGSSGPFMLVTGRWEAIGFLVLAAIFVSSVLVYAIAKYCCGGEVALTEEEKLRNIGLLTRVDLARFSAKEPLGMTVAQGPGKASLVVRSVARGGLVERWNHAAPNAVSRVRVGDRVVLIAYAGMGGERLVATSAAAMQAALSRKTLCLVVSAMGRKDTEVCQASSAVTLRKSELDDLGLVDVEGGRAGREVIRVGAQVEARNAALRAQGASCTALVEVGDRLVTVLTEERETTVRLVKLCRPEHVRTVEFKVNLERQGFEDRLGMLVREGLAPAKHMDVLGTTEFGMLQRFNDSPDATTKVLPGDRLVSVNGKTGAQAMLAELKASALELCFERVSKDADVGSEAVTAQFQGSRVVDKAPGSARFGVLSALMIIVVAVGLRYWALAEDDEAPVLEEAGTCDPAEGHRYYRISNGGPVQDDRCDSTWDLYEVAFFVGSKVAHRARVSAFSSEQTQNPARNLVDRNSASYWMGDPAFIKHRIGGGCPRSSVGRQWVEFDLKYDAPVSAITVRQAESDPTFSVSTMRFQCSRDGATWTLPTEAPVKLTDASDIYRDEVSDWNLIVSVKSEFEWEGLNGKHNKLSMEGDSLRWEHGKEEGEGSCYFSRSMRFWQCAEDYSILTVKDAEGLEAIVKTAKADLEEDWDDWDEDEDEKKGGASSSAAPGKQEEEPVVSEYAKWMEGGGDGAAPPTTTTTTTTTTASVKSAALQATKERAREESVWYGMLSSARDTLSCVWRLASDEVSSPEDCAKAANREAIKDAKAAVKENAQAQKRFRALLDSGDDEEALAQSALDGVCVDRQVAEYKYEVCFFKEAKQGSTRLGKWKRWDSGVALFDEGDKCWSGPQRSLRVALRCSPTIELGEVSEPSQCTYAASLFHPSACSQADLTALAAPVPASALLVKF